MPSQTNQVALPVSPETERHLGLLDYLDIIIRYKQFVVSITLLAFILSIVISLLLPNKYSSEALILPPQQDNSLAGLMFGAMGGGLGGLAGDLLGKGSLADMYASVLKSDRMSDAIIDRFKLMEVYDVAYRTEMYNVIDQLVSISVGKKDGIISITVVDRNPQLAADIANAYVDELGKLTVELNMTGGSKNRQYLEKRLVLSRADLAKAEEEIKKFQTKNKTIDVTEQAKASITGIAGLQAQLTLLDIQLAGLRRRLTENSQEVKDTKAAITRIKANITQLEGNDKGGTIPNVGTIPVMGQEYIRLMREFKIQETLVELLTKQYELAKLSEQKDVSNVQVLQSARPSDKKYKPKRSVIVIIATFFGFVGAVFASFVVEFFRRLPTDELTRLREMAQQLISWRSTSKSNT